MQKALELLSRGKYLILLAIFLGLMIWRDGFTVLIRDWEFAVALIAEKSAGKGKSRSKAKPKAKATAKKAAKPKKAAKKA